MASSYASIAFTDKVRDAQTRYGSRNAAARREAPPELAGVPDSLTDAEKTFIAERDGFYLATTGETGWPYVQFRGGPAGFLRAIDDHMLGWADFRGNRQYISTGNVAGNDRVSLFLMDYPNRRRLKIFGRASIIDEDDGQDVIARLRVSGYTARVERAVLVRVEAYDWNCPQHITPRYTTAELETGLALVREHIAELQRENDRLRARLAAGDAST